MRDRLMKIEKTVAQYQDSILNDLTNEQMDRVRKWFEDNLETNDISEFIKLMSIANGFEFNGFILYSLDPDSDNEFLEANEVWHENHNFKKYIFFADSDISWYCFDMETKIFCELDKPTGDEVCRFNDYRSMMISALDNVI